MLKAANTRLSTRASRSCRVPASWGCHELLGSETTFRWKRKTDEWTECNEAWSRRWRVCKVGVADAELW